jgi:hypothetical protein
MARTRGIKCPRCKGIGARKQRYALLDRGCTTWDWIDCPTCDGEGRLGPVIVAPSTDGNCQCGDGPTLNHVCVQRGPVNKPEWATFCATHRQYLAR